MVSPVTLELLVALERLEQRDDQALDHLASQGRGVTAASLGRPEALEHAGFQVFISFSFNVDFRLYGRHLDKSISRHNFAVDSPITTKFGMQMQKDMPMTTHDIGHNGNRK